MNGTSADDLGSKLFLVLAVGETIAWSGRPGQGIRLRAIDAFLIPFCAVWTAFAISSVTSFFASGFGPGMIVGASFIVTGFGVLIGRFAFDAYQRANITYAVTDRAAYVVIGGVLAKTVTYRPSALAEIEIAVSRGDTGTIRFKRSTSSIFASGGWAIWIPDNGAQFYRITEVARVYALLRDLADRA